MRGWRSPYTLQQLAINTWVGEEAAHHRRGISSRLAGPAARQALTWRKPAGFGVERSRGTVLATRGWGLHDRQSTLFGRSRTTATGWVRRTVFYDDMTSAWATTRDLS